MIASPTPMQSDYLTGALRPSTLSQYVDGVVDRLTEYKNEFDYIAFRGVSGALVAPAVALRLNKALIVVRKGESTHSSHKVEGPDVPGNYVIVDDQITTGATVAEIVKRISDYLHPLHKCVGVALYLETLYWGHVLRPIRDDRDDMVLVDRVWGCKPTGVHYP